MCQSKKNIIHFEWNSDLRSEILENRTEDFHHDIYFVLKRAARAYSITALIIGLIAMMDRNILLVCIFFVRQDFFF